MADEADEAYQAGNPNREMQFYDEVKNKLTENARQYWQELLKTQPPQYPYLG